jgi:hypothetical protein
VKKAVLRSIIREEVYKVLSENNAKKYTNKEYTCIQTTLPKQFKRVWTHGFYPNLKAAMDAIMNQDTLDLRGDEITGWETIHKRVKRKPEGVKAAIEWFKKYNSPDKKGPFAQVTPIAGGSNSYDDDDWPKLLDISYLKT